MTGEHPNHGWSLHPQHGRLFYELMFLGPNSEVARRRSLLGVIGILPDMVRGSRAKDDLITVSAIPAPAIAGLDGAQRGGLLRHLDEHPCDRKAYETIQVDAIVADGIRLIGQDPDALFVLLRLFSNVELDHPDGQSCSYLLSQCSVTDHLTLSARLPLGNEIEWRDQILAGRVISAIPETLRAASVGRPLRELVRHPATDPHDLVIGEWVVRDGDDGIKLSHPLPMVRLTTHLPDLTAPQPPQTPTGACINSSLHHRG